MLASDRGRGRIFDFNSYGEKIALKKRKRCDACQMRWLPTTIACLVLSGERFIFLGLNSKKLASNGPVVQGVKGATTCLANRGAVGLGNVSRTDIVLIGRILVVNRNSGTCFLDAFSSYLH